MIVNQIKQINQKIYQKIIDLNVGKRKEKTTFKNEFNEGDKVNTNSIGGKGV